MFRCEDMYQMCACQSVGSESNCLLLFFFLHKIVTMVANVIELFRHRQCKYFDCNLQYWMEWQILYSADQA